MNYRWGVCKLIEHVLIISIVFDCCRLRKLLKLDNYDCESALATPMGSTFHWPQSSSSSSLSAATRANNKSEQVGDKNFTLSCTCTFAWPYICTMIMDIGSRESSSWAHLNNCPWSEQLYCYVIVISLVILTDKPESGSSFSLHSSYTHPTRLNFACHFVGIDTSQKGAKQVQTDTARTKETARRRRQREAMRESSRDQRDFNDLLCVVRWSHTKVFISVVVVH